MQFKWQPFSKLSTEELYNILALRSEVFVVEQRCIYLDLDGLDQKAIHLLAIENANLIAYLRLFLPNPLESAVIFGRLATRKDVRTKGYGKALMNELLNYSKTHFPSAEIKCSAQLYLQKFYENFGFEVVSEVYLEDDIPHVAMKKNV